MYKEVLSMKWGYEVGEKGRRSDNVTVGWQENETVKW